MRPPARECEAAGMPILAGACLLAALAWAYLLAGHGGYWRTDQRLPGAGAAGRMPPEQWPSVVAVVPARDEAAVLPLTLPSLMAADYPGEFSVVLVDDGSTDGTAAVAAALGRNAAARGPGRAGVGVEGAAGGPGRQPAGRLGRQGLGHGAGSAGRGRLRVRAVHRRGHRLRAGHADRPGARRRGRPPRPRLADGVAARGHWVGAPHRPGVRLLLRPALPVPLGEPARLAHRGRGRRMHAGAP